MHVKLEKKWRSGELQGDAETEWWVWRSVLVFHSVADDELEMFIVDFFWLIGCTVCFS